MSLAGCAQNPRGLGTSPGPPAWVHPFRCCLLPKHSSPRRPFSWAKAVPGCLTGAQPPENSCSVKELTEGSQGKSRDCTHFPQPSAKRPQLRLVDFWSLSCPTPFFPSSSTLACHRYHTALKQVSECRPLSPDAVPRVTLQPSNQPVKQ